MQAGTSASHVALVRTEEGCDVGSKVPRLEEEVCSQAPLDRRNESCEVAPVPWARPGEFARSSCRAVLNSTARYE